MSFIIKPAKKILLATPIPVEDIGGSTIIVTTEGKKSGGIEVGKVQAIGKGVLPIPVKVGDIVTYRTYGATKILIGGEDRLFISFDDVLGVVNPE